MLVGIPTKALAADPNTSVRSATRLGEHSPPSLAQQVECSRQQKMLDHSRYTGTETVTDQTHYARSYPEEIRKTSPTSACGEGASCPWHKVPPESSTVLNSISNFRLKMVSCPGDNQISLTGRCQTALGRPAVELVHTLELRTTERCTGTGLSGASLHTIESWFQADEHTASS